MRDPLIMRLIVHTVVRQVGLGPAGLEAHAGEARLVLRHEQRQPLRLRVLPGFLARHGLQRAQRNKRKN